MRSGEGTGSPRPVDEPRASVDAVVGEADASHRAARELLLPGCPSEPPGGLFLRGPWPGDDQRRGVGMTCTSSGDEAPTLEVSTRVTGEARAEPSASPCIPGLSETGPSGRDTELPRNGDFSRAWLTDASSAAAAAPAAATSAAAKSSSAAPAALAPSMSTSSAPSAPAAARYSAPSAPDSATSSATTGEAASTSDVSSAALATSASAASTKGASDPVASVAAGSSAAAEGSSEAVDCMPKAGKTGTSPDDSLSPMVAPLGVPDLFERPLRCGTGPPSWVGSAPPVGQGYGKRPRPAIGACCVQKGWAQPS
mmetsp:Transcript_52170/g.167900  ORF Transcript_52170/g.167900 Transcript_52170/m.167900 type:complete len:311 (+) Transcript_52170:2239-3171(+)